MDNVTDLRNSTPPANQRRNSCQRGSSSSTRANFVSRGGFANQRGPGRGGSRSRASNQQSSGSNQSQGASWGNRTDRGRGAYSFTESRSTASAFVPGRSIEDELKGIVSGDDHQSNKSYIKNTVDFTPNHIPAEMRVLPAPAGLKKYHRDITSRDVIIVSDMFSKPEDTTLYRDVITELDSNPRQEWLLWHGDNHMLANHKTMQHQAFYPSLDRIVKTVEQYFNMKVSSTQINWFRDTQDWKPYHFNVSALNPEKAKVQNFTVTVSFGSEREIAFQNGKTGATVAIPLPNGTVFSFCNDVNAIWRHGVPQIPPNRQANEGHIGIVLWGWVNGIEEVS